MNAQISVEKIIFKNSIGEDLVGILSNPNSDHVVIMAHGLNSCKDRERYIWLEKKMNALGIASFRFDFAGCGESSGNQIDINISKGIDDIANAHELMRRRFKKVSFIGVSFGGTILATYLRNRTDSTFNVFLCTPFNYKMHLETTYKHELEKWEEDGFRLDVSSTTGKVNKIGFGLYTDSLQYVGFDYLRDIKGLSILFHGDADNEIDCIQSITATKFIENSELYILEGCGHKIDFDKYPEARRKLEYFIEKNK